MRTLVYTYINVGTYTATYYLHQTNYRTLVTLLDTSTLPVPYLPSGGHSAAMLTHCTTVISLSLAVQLGEL